jgi:hypothetical protein
MGARKRRPRKASAASTEMTESQARKHLDRRARQLLGMSGEEFVRRAREGKLPESAAVSHLLAISGAG